MTGPALDRLDEDTLTGGIGAAGEPSWLRERRLEALRRYLDQPWPDSRRDEYWRSTPFQRFHMDLEVVTNGHVAAPVRDPATSEAAPERLPDGAAGTLDELAVTGGAVELRDSAVVSVRLSDELAARGVILTDLRTAAREHPELVRAHLGSLTTSDRDGTGAGEDRTITANDAAWTGGAFLYVPPDVELDEPLGIHLHVSRPGAHLPRILAVIDHHARASIYIEHTSDADLSAPATVDEVVEVVVNDGARADVATLHEWSGPVGHLSLQKAAVHRDARYRHLAVNIGGQTVRLRPEVDLVGPGASCEPLGIYFADEGQHFDLQPYIRHIAPHTTSDVLYRGALQGRARTVFRGNILVGPDAVGASANENNKSLLLSDGARADSTPFLEILCSDVSAGHGSATGQIDRDRVFYLQARGIPRPEAVRLIVLGFFREVLDAFDLPALRDRALAHIERELGRTDLSAISLAEEGAA